MKIYFHRLLIVFLMSMGPVLWNAAGAQSPCRDFEDCLKDLKSQDTSKKSGAVFMLGNMKDKRATPALLEILKTDPDSGIRLSAIKAVGYLRDPAAVTALTGFLDDQDLQQEAVRALVKIGNKLAVEALIQGLKHSEIQVAAAQGLGEIAHPSSKPALLALFRRSDDDRVRGVSALAIQRINSIWGPSEEEMGIPLYPKSEFIPNA
ncbi:MAG: HEAT repeat domain-containing protein, partial [Nitrospirae bacterium]|nr:HEAT repeat domain-containing protein [Nitrospirota bacterium]